MIKLKVASPLLVILEKDKSVEINLGITFLDDTCLYIPYREIILPFIKDADAFVKRDHKTAFFLANTFYSYKSDLPCQIHIRHLE